MDHIDGYLDTVELLLFDILPSICPTFSSLDWNYVNLVVTNSSRMIRLLFSDGILDESRVHCFQREVSSPLLDESLSQRGMLALSEENSQYVVFASKRSL